MTLRRRAATLAFIAVTLTAATVAAQTSTAGRETSAASVASYGLSQKMPVDPEVVVGTLPNGLRYYIRPNAETRAPCRTASRRQGRFGPRRR